MSKLLLLTSAFLLLVSGALGFINKGKIATKQDDLDKTRSVAKAAQADATSSKAKQKTAEKAASEAAAKSADLQTQLSAATTQVTTLNGQIDEAKKNVADKEGQIKQLQDTIAKNLNPNAPKTGDAAAPDMAAKVQEMEIQLAELKTVREGLESNLKSTQNQVAALEKEKTARATGASMNGLTGKILAVNHDWNFVVLSLGNNRGVNANATMIVQRGGSTVGKVRITSVEPSQSIADIIPNSVPAGINVQAGDTVVYPGS